MPAIGTDDDLAETLGKLNSRWVSQLMGIRVGWIEIEGYRNRVDELNLVGNGVVPATAEKAYITLYDRLTRPIESMQLSF